MHSQAIKSRSSLFVSRGFLALSALLLSGIFLAQPASANEKLDCLDDILSLGLNSRNNLVVDADPDTALQVRKDLAIRVWVAFWQYDAGDFVKAQWAMNSYNTLLTELQSEGVVDLAAAGQPDIAPLYADVSSCVNNPPAPLATGLQVMQSNSVDREFYVQLPSDYDTAEPKPLVFAYHGYTGSYTNWVGENPYYDFVEVVGDDAIIVVPQALKNAQDQTNWGGQDDYNFFLDMISELELQGLVYDPNRLFVVGHSNGAGFTHSLGCEYGDIIRGIATAAGALLTEGACTGSLASLMMQGSNDPLTDSNLAISSRRYWVLYNGWEETEFGPSAFGACDDYSITTPAKPANQPYPVLWCEHTQGHAWPDYGSETVWDFFTNLPEALPTSEHPPGGGHERTLIATDASITFQISIPISVNQPDRYLVTLREPSYIDSPTCSAPNVVMSAFHDPHGVLVPGEVSAQITLPVAISLGAGALFAEDGTLKTADWAMVIAIYVEGGSTSVIPTPFVDQEVKIPVTLQQNPDTLDLLPIVISGIQVATPVPNLCGF